MVDVLDTTNSHIYCAHTVWHCCEAHIAERARAARDFRIGCEIWLEARICGGRARNSGYNSRVYGASLYYLCDNNLYVIVEA